MTEDVSIKGLRRRIILLGSTGSIGTATLDVVTHLQSLGAELEIIGLAAGANATGLSKQARTFGVRHVAIGDADRAGDVAAVERVEAGPDAAETLVRAIARPGDLVFGAIVGSAGIRATLAAIEHGCDVALANKETLVAAGAIVMPAARAAGVRILPVDSEHNAIFQCLEARRSIDEVARVVLTASGGPFRTWTAEAMAAATVDEALAHPTWSMGRKVTIDSATLMNKALELIEAHWFFGLESSRLDAIVHPQSLVHGFVEFIDGSVIGQLGAPDMRTPIQHVICWPHRRAGCSRTLDWTTLRRMDFEPVDHERFPAIGLARRVIDEGGTSGAVLNAANEAAVEAFLEGKVPFGRIQELVAGALCGVPPGPVNGLEDVMRADAAGRRFVQSHLARSGTETAGRR